MLNKNYMEVDMSIDVSVIVPVYNVERYIKQCLESIINQTYKNIEIILVDDGSTDKSNIIIKKYIKENSNIKYIKQNNSGVSVARNNGLKHAIGEFILFVDPDDYLYEEYIEKAYNKAKETDSDIVISGHTLVYDDGIKGVDKFICKNMDEKKIYSGKCIAEKMLSLEIEGYLWDKLFKKKKLKELYFEPNRYIQDWYPVFKLVYQSSKITFINEPLYNYRQRSSSTVNKNNEKLVKDFSHAVDEIIKYCSENNFETKAILEFKIKTFNGIISRYSKMKVNKTLKSYYKFYKLDCNIHEPSTKDVVIFNKLNFKTKLSILLWKLRIRHLFL